MKKWTSEHELKPKTVKVQCEEDWQKRLAHGHLCPYCKLTLLTVSNCKVVYIVPNGISTQSMYGYRFIFCKANRKVCCSECAPDIQSRYNDYNFLSHHVIEVKAWLGINKTGRIKKINEKKGDGYMEYVLKKNGIEPSSIPMYKVYKPEDPVGEIAGTLFEPFLRVFS